MTVTLQVYDEIRSAVLFDLNDPLGANAGTNGYTSTKLSNDPDLGSPQLQSSTVEAQDIDATYSAFSKRATASVKASVWIAGTSYENLVTAVGTLAQYLTQGCVLKYISGTNTYFIDVLPSPTPTLVGGQEDALYGAAGRFMQKIELELVRQPYLRMAGLTASTNKLTNPTLLRDSNADGLPDGWTLSGGAMVIDATRECLTMTSSSSSAGIYQRGMAATPGQVWTASVEAWLVVDAGDLTVYIQFLDAGFATLATSTNIITTTAGSGFLRYTGTSSAAPASTAWAQMVLQTTGNGSVGRWRRAQMELASAASTFRVNAETVKLDPAGTGMAKMVPVYNPGTAPSPMTITTAFPDASTNVQAMDFFLATSDGIPGNKYLSDYLNGPYYAQAEANGNGWTLTAGTDATLAGAADATHSPGSGTTVARITHATDPNTYNKRISFTRSTLLDCMRGKHRVFAAVKPASKTNYRLQLAWSAGSTTTETNDEFLLQQTNNTAVARVLCDMGTIELPENTAVTLGGLTLDLFTKMGQGKAAANLDIDYLMLVPQDNSAHLDLGEIDSGVWSVTAGADAQVPKDLGAGDPTWVTGSVSGTGIRLDSVNEAVGVGSTTTGGFTGTTGGVHACAFTVQLADFIGTVNIEVANITDNDLLDVGGNSMSLSYVYSVASNVTLTPTIQVAEELSDKYQPRVTITAYTSGTVTVRSLLTKPLYALVQNQQVRADPGSTGLDRYAAERLDSGSFYVGALDADRVPFWVPPGLSLLWVEAYDVGVGGAELPHFNARTLTVTPTVYPRFWA